VSGVVLVQIAETPLPSGHKPTKAMPKSPPNPHDDPSPHRAINPPAIATGPIRGPLRLATGSASFGPYRLTCHSCGKLMADGVSAEYARRKTMYCASCREWTSWTISDHAGARRKA
jgi:hypothetical protein